MFVRKAENKDLSQCEKLVHVPEMRLATGGYFKKFFLKKYLDENYFLVAEDKKTIAGLILGEPTKAHGAIIWMLVVSKKNRGKGIGSLLLKEFEKRLKKLEVQWIVLYGYRKNPKVLNFYRKHKFSEGVGSIEFVKNI